uniref:Uncharacterized protein n=1 Tax=Thermogemmatispora argillosa TaxID=2045280 RepID=A0A455T2X7_9CHLR|nr:hypothetical protein KTA_24670 [Thermogemmatispora argillosa]
MRTKEHKMIREKRGGSAVKGNAGELTMAEGKGTAGARRREERGEERKPQRGEQAQKRVPS